MNYPAQEMAMIFSITVFLLLFSVCQSDDVDFEWSPLIRVGRGSDYGSNVGGPVAASGNTVDPETGPPPVDATVSDSCPPSDCKYDMRAQQRQTQLHTGNHKSLGFGTCNTLEDCQKECEKRGCNYLEVGGLSPPYLQVHFFSLDPPPGSQGDSYTPAEMFDSFSKSCSKPNRNRRSNGGLLQKILHPGGNSKAKPPPAQLLTPKPVSNRNPTPFGQRQTPKPHRPSSREHSSHSSESHTNSSSTYRGQTCNSSWSDQSDRNQSHSQSNSGNRGDFHTQSRSSSDFHTQSRSHSSRNRVEIHTQTRSSSTNRNETSWQNQTRTSCDTYNSTNHNESRDGRNVSTSTNSSSRSPNRTNPSTTPPKKPFGNLPPVRNAGMPPLSGLNFGQWTEAEKILRAQNFQENTHWIDQLNKATKFPDDAKLGRNAFVYEDRKTFPQRFGGSKVNEKEDTSVPVHDTPKESTAITGKGKVDWRQFNVIPPVRYQGSCGACYAFAASDIIAAQNAIERRKSRNENVQPLSPQYLMDCSPSSAAGGCNGGRPIRVLEAVSSDLSTGGVPFEGCHRYKGQPSNSCPTDTTCCQRRKIQKAKMLDISGSNEKQLMQSLLNAGPVLSIVNINEVWQFYSGTGIIKSHQCNATDRNHAISIIGYDFTASTPHYIVKNSWSTSWGSQGYAKLEAGTNACGVAKNVVTTCVRNCQSTMKDMASILARNNLPRR